MKNIKSLVLLVFAAFISLAAFSATADAMSYVGTNDGGHKIYIDESSAVVFYDTGYRKNFAINIYSDDSSHCITIWYEVTNNDTDDNGSHIFRWSHDGHNYHRFYQRQDIDTYVFYRAFKAAYGYDFDC